MPRVTIALAFVVLAGCGQAVEPGGATKTVPELPAESAAVPTAAPTAPSTASPTALPPRAGDPVEVLLLRAPPTADSANDTELFPLLLRPEGNCLFRYDGGGNATTVVWPPGYSATTDGDGWATVFDEAGVAVMTTGETIELPGRAVEVTDLDLSTIDGTKLCGASRVWIAAGAGRVMAADDPSLAASEGTQVLTPGETVAPPFAMPLTDERGVAVRMIAVVTEGGRLCPAAMAGCRSSVAVEGGLGGMPAGQLVSAVGWYDGARLLLAGPPGAVESPFPDYSDRSRFASRCPEMSNPAGAASDAVLPIANSILGRTNEGDHDALAAAWIDNTANVVTLLFARHLDRYRGELESAFAAAGVQVCLAEGAEFSEGEYRQESGQVEDLGGMHGFRLQDSLGDDITQRRVVSIEAIDADGLAALAQLRTVVAVPFIALIDRPLAELPAWSTAGDDAIDLLTATTRASGGMAALGTFTLHHDVTAKCLYSVSPDGRRTGLVWPLGYSTAAIDGVVHVVDGAGTSQAAVGVEVSIGGGWVGATIDRNNVAGTNLCGAEDLFIVNLPS